MSAGVPVTRRHLDHHEANHGRPLWWLHPRWAVLLLGIPLLIVAYLIPENSYLMLFLTEKHVDLNFLMVGMIIYAGFVAGSFFAVGAGGGAQGRDIQLYCRWFVWPFFALTVLGYVVWSANAMLVAGGPGPLIGALVELMFVPSAGASDYVKTELFRNIPGITTLVHLNTLYATTEALLWARGRTRDPFAILRFATVASFTLLHALLLSERLILFEVAVPFIVVLAASARPGPIRRWLAQFAPLYLGLAAFMLFIFSEYFRSWNYYRGTYAGSYLEFATQRFLGYYATAINNSALFYYQEILQPLRWTLNDLFVFPVLGDDVYRGYLGILGYEPVGTERLLEIYANPELNNVAFIGLLPNEYSVFLAPVAALLLGLLSSSLYRSFVKGRLIGALLYPGWFIGLVEISRIYFWTNQRFFPTLVFLAASLLLFEVAKVPVKQSPTRNGSRRSPATLRGGSKP